MIESLTKQESAELEELEFTIRSSLNEMEAAGRALIAIRDRKLYRAEFRTFKEYVSQKWEMSWKQAYRLCDSANVIANLKESVQLDTLPEKESQTRELAKLAPEDQATVWKEAVLEGETTASKINRIGKEFAALPPEEKEKVRSGETTIVEARETKSPKPEPRRKGSYEHWKQFRDLCGQATEAIDAMEGLVVDYDHIIPAREAATKLCKKLEKIINNIE